MLLAAVICMFSATLILAVVDCFLKKHKAISLLLQILTITSLFCSAFVLVHFKNSFSIFSIMLIASILPQIISLFDIKEIIYGPNKEEEVETEKTTEMNVENPQTDNISEINEDNTSSKQYLAENSTEIYEETEPETACDVENEVQSPDVTQPTQSKLAQSNGLLLKSIGICLTSVFLSICGLFLGLESVYLYLLGFAIAALGTFILLVIKKKINIFDLISYSLVFFAAGLAITQVLTVLIYSTSLVNILYSVGMLGFTAYSILSVTVKNKFLNLIYLASMLILLSIFLI